MRKPGDRKQLTCLELKNLCIFLTETALESTRVRSRMISFWHDHFPFDKAKDDDHRKIYPILHEFLYSIFRSAIQHSVMNGSGVVLCTLIRNHYNYEPTSLVVPAWY